MLRDTPLSFVLISVEKSFLSQTLLAETKAILTSRHISRHWAQCGISATSCVVDQHLTSLGLCCYHLALEASWDTSRNCSSDSWNVLQHLLQTEVPSWAAAISAQVFFFYFDGKSLPHIYHICIYNRSQPPSLVLLHVCYWLQWWDNGQKW